MSTIAPAPDHGLRPRVSRRNVTAARCWCGQDLEHVRGEHCPRCGSWRSSLESTLGSGLGSAPESMPGSDLGSDLGSALLRPGVQLPALSGRP